MKPTLGSAWIEIFKTRAETVVFVKGDPDLEFQTVAKAIDIAHGAGIDKVGLMTPQGGGRPVMKRNFLILPGLASLAACWPSRYHRMREAEGPRQPE